MKNQAQIEERLRRLVRQALDQHMASLGEKLPHKCKHNHRQPLDHRKTIYGESNPAYNRISAGKDASGVSLPVVQTLGLCLYGASSPDAWRGDICEDPIDAQCCDVYAPLMAKEALYSEFVSQVSSEEWLARQLPECWSLLWVLGEGITVQQKRTEEPPKSSSISAFLSGLRRRWREFWHSASVPSLELPLPEGSSAGIAVYIPSLEDYDDGIRTLADPREIAPAR